VIPEAGYLREVERLCRAHDAFLIVDEIQTGLGRLGTLWGLDPEGIAPDVMLVAKGLSGGVVPVGAAVATAGAFRGLNDDPFLHSSTYAGNPLAAAAAKAAVETTIEEDVPARAAALGTRILELLSDALREGCPELVADVRGRGLLIAAEFRQDHFAADFMFELLGQGVIISTSLNAQRTARLHPPVVMDESDVEWLAGALRASAESIGRRYSTQTKGAGNATR
jgi:putrescine aminotransferase